MHPQDAEALKMVLRMDALFLVDRQAREQGLTGPERLALRKEHAGEWVQEIRQACLILASQTLPQSALGKAVAYTLNMWAKLDVGAVKAGPRVAAILSIVESCRRLRLPIKQYLADVLPGLATRTLPQIADLTPARWAAARS